MIVIVLVVKAEHLSKVSAALTEYSTYNNDALLCIPFTTLADYLHLLKGASQKLTESGVPLMFYLAAAVSDFYVPKQQLVSKIEGGVIQITKLSDEDINLDDKIYSS